MNARVDIVLPTRDRLDYLRDAVDSVRAQTYGDWRLIVADDGSGPETRAWLHAQKDSRIRLLELSRLTNPAAVRNAALAEAGAPHLAFLDSDDSWTPDYLAQQLRVLDQRPACRWVYCKTRMIDAHGALRPEKDFREWQPFEGHIAAALLRREASVATASVVVERSLVEESGPFDAQLRFGEHYELWLRLALRSPVAVNPLPMVHIRTHAENYTRDRVATAEGWCLFYARVERTLDDRRLRALCREMRGIAALDLARVRVAHRDWRGGMKSLLRSVPAGVGNAAWWRSLAGALRRAG